MMKSVNNLIVPQIGTRYTTLNQLQQRNRRICLPKVIELKIASVSMPFQFEHIQSFIGEKGSLGLKALRK